MAAMRCLWEMCDSISHRAAGQGIRAVSWRISDEAVPESSGDAVHTS